MPYEDVWVDVEVAEIEWESPKSYRCRIEGKAEKQFMPKSQLKGTYVVGQCDLTMTVKEWIAKAKGLDYSDHDPSSQQLVIEEHKPQASGRSAFSNDDAGPDYDNNTEIPF